MFTQTAVRKIRSLHGRMRRFFVSQRFGFSPSQIYNVDFYEGPGCQQGAQSADAYARILAAEFAPSSVFDVGCGNGAYLAEFARRDIEAYGCEGSEHGVRRCMPGTFVFKWDLKQPLAVNRKFDLVTCIEVAEHLPKKSAGVLVESIAALAQNSIVFCAAPPSAPPGDDHINCQEPAYWDGLFQARGWLLNAERSARIRAELAKAGCPFWLCDTTQVYEPRTAA